MDFVLRYLLSTGNIVGSCLALMVVGAYLTGLIGGGGLWWLVLGAYVGGGLPFAFKKAPRHMPDSLSTADALKWLRYRALPKLPAAPKKVLADIIHRVDGLMPRLKEMESQGLVEAPSRAMLKHTVTRLLPDSVEAYLRLPPAYAQMTKFGDGKTAPQVLTEQLMLLQAHVVELEENLLSADVNSMLANGRFLQEKFQKNSPFG